MRIAILVIAAVIGQGLPAVAQTAAPAVGQTETKPKATGKSAECRSRAREQKLHKQERQDFLQLCRQEGRTVCLKQAIEQKIIGRARGEFIKTCMN
jgi:hypothetical protein